LKVEKNYTLGFDRFGMFRWFDIISQNDKKEIVVFHGQENSDDLAQSYSTNNLKFFKEVFFMDGYGLESNACLFRLNIYLVILNILFFTF